MRYVKIFAANHHGVRTSLPVARGRTLAPPCHTAPRPYLGQGEAAAGPGSSKLDGQRHTSVHLLPLPPPSPSPRVDGRQCRLGVQEHLFPHYATSPTIGITGGVNKPVGTPLPDSGPFSKAGPSWADIVQDREPSSLPPAISWQAISWQAISRHEFLDLYERCMNSGL